VKILIEAIGIDKPGGGRTSIINLLENMFKLDFRNNYTILVTKHEPIFDQFINVAQIIVPIRNRFLIRLWAQLVIPIRFRNFDLVHFTKNLSVFFINIPSIITIHDLTVLVYPQFSPWIDVLYWKTVQKWSVQRSSLIIAVSNNTARDIQKYYNIGFEKITVIYHGIASFYKPATPLEQQRVIMKYGLPRNYIITVGRIDLKKNLTSLIKAYASIQGKIDPSIKLVFVGEVYKKSDDKALVPTIGNYRLNDKVIFTGQVPDEDLPGLYSGAILCVFPSLHEGFGLVALEALACGVPLISHNSSATVEVVQDSGVKVDAGNVSELGSAIVKVISDDKLKEQLRISGLIQAKKFDWQKAAEQTLDTYSKIYKNV